MMIVDLSYYQGVIPVSTFASWKAAGVTRVIVKAGGADGGTIYKDSHHDANVANARTVGLGVDHYFFNGTVDPSDSARSFASFASPAPGDGLWFDIENEGSMAHWSPAEALTGLQVLKTLTGRIGGVYMSSSVTTSADWSQVVAFGARLWVASYGSNDGTEQGQPTIGYWKSYTYWQFTSVGHEPGYSGNLDISTTDGTPDVVVPIVTTSTGYNASTTPTATIQSELIKLGFNLGASGADGIYGPATTAAVHAFEVKEHLSVDVGIAGPEVVAKLAALTGAPTPKPVVGPNLKVDGIAGPATTTAEQAALQAHKLNIGTTHPDGKRGPGTIAAEQRLTGAKVDGQDGPDTARHLQAYLIARGFSCGATGADGARGPATIEALQRALNAGKF